MDAPKYADPVIAPTSAFAGLFDHPVPDDRVRHARRAARAFREQMLARPPVRFFASFDLVKVPYPTRYAFRDACALPTPYAHILNRLFVVQFASPQGLKTLLAEPLDRIANARTPFFKRLAAPLGGVDGRVARRVWPPLGDVEEILARLGIRPEDVDYVTYDHLHTQDLRKWLGERAVFPNAKLLVTTQEWQAAQGLLPLDAQWYCPGGTDIPRERVVLLDDDVLVGDGVALVRTPGHTMGNHSIVVHAENDLFVTSENGVAADSYAPAHSRIAGLRRWARTTGAEVVLNGNTLESAVDQYVSMILEKEIAGASSRNPEFPNVAPSSELTPHPLSPGLSPTFRVGALRFGDPVAAQPKAPR